MCKKIIYIHQPDKSKFQWFPSLFNWTILLIDYIFNF